MEQKESRRVFDKFDICNYLGYLKSEESHNLQKCGIRMDDIFWSWCVYHGVGA